MTLEVIDYVWNNCTDGSEHDWAIYLTLPEVIFDLIARHKGEVLVDQRVYGYMFSIMKLSPVSNLYKERFVLRFVRY